MSETVIVVFFKSYGEYPEIVYNKVSKRYEYQP